MPTPYDMSYSGAGQPAPDKLTPSGYVFFRGVLDHIFKEHNDLAAATPYKDTGGGMSNISYISIAAAGNVTGVSVVGAPTYSGSPFSYSKSGQAGTFRVNNDATVSAPGFIGNASSATTLSTVGTEGQLLGFSGGTWKGITPVGSQLQAGSVTSDRMAGLWYSANTTTALVVDVRRQNVWHGATLIRFRGASAPAISAVGIQTGQCRLDLLYIDLSGALRWQIGTPSAVSLPSLPTMPTGSFVPVVIVKTYSGSVSITGYDDLGHDSCFIEDVRTYLNPNLSASIGPHSLSSSVLLEGSVFQTNPAGLSLNVAKLGYYNSQYVWQDFIGGIYTYQYSQLANTVARWDLIFLDDNRGIGLTQGPEDGTLNKPQATSGQWPLAFIYIPPNGCNQIVDELNYIAGTALMGYIHLAPAIYASMSSGVPFNSATATIQTSGTSPNIQVTGVTITNPTTNGPYTFPPAVVFNGGTGTAAVATTAHSGGVQNGQVKTVQVTTPGAYTIAPTSVSFDATGGITPITRGGTGAGTAAAARVNLNAAAYPSNNDVTAMTALASVTGNVTFSGGQILNNTVTTQVPLITNAIASTSVNIQEWRSSNSAVMAVSPLGNLVQNNAGSAVILPQVMLQQLGTVGTGLTSVNPWGIRQDLHMRPQISGGSARWLAAGNMTATGDVVMDTFSAIDAYLQEASVIHVGPIQRKYAGGVNLGVIQVWSITPSGASSAGSYTISDGYSHTTAAILPTAAMGVWGTDTVVAGNNNTVNNILYEANINYSASGGPFSSGTTIYLTALSSNPGLHNPITIPTNTTGVTLTPAAYQNATPYINYMQGIFVNAPTGGQRNYAIATNGLIGVDTSAIRTTGWVDESWANGGIAASAKMTRQANESIATFQAIAQGSNTNTEKDIVCVFGINYDQSDLLAAGNPQRDLVGVDSQVFGASPQARVFALNLQTSFLSGDGNSLIAEARIDNSGMDGMYLNYNWPGAYAYQKGGTNFVIRGPQPATFGHLLSGGGSYYHNGFVCDVNAIGTGGFDTAFGITGASGPGTGKFGVRSDGRAGFGVEQPMTNVYGDFRGDVRVGGNIRFSKPALNTSLGGSGAIDPANGTVQTFQNSTASIGDVRILQPPATAYDGTTGAGSTPMLMIVNESNSFTITYRAYDASLTWACLPATTLTQPVRSVWTFVWRGGIGWFKVG